MRRRINIFLGLILLALLSLTACEQYNWDPPVWDPTVNENPVRPRPLVYDDHVAPLFESYNCTACHGAGAIPPDLSAGNSFSSLTGGNYLDANEIEESTIAVRVADPEHGGSWSTLDYFTLLDWIYNESSKK